MALAEWSDPFLILVVDQDLAARANAVFVLERSGYRVFHTADGDDALALAQREHPQLILLSLNLAGTPDAVEVCRRIKADPATAKILILATVSADSGPLQRIGGLQAGADALLAQSAETAEMLASVQALMRLAQRERQISAPTASAVQELAVSRESRGSSSELESELAPSQAPPVPSDLYIHDTPLGTVLRRKRVLVVDDNRMQAQSLATLLEMMGFEARPALDGTSALELAREFLPHVAMIDIVLPDIDGYELARRLRTLPGLAQITLIAQTGLGRAQDKTSAQSAGFDYHFTKPIDHDLLEKILRYESNR